MGRLREIQQEMLELLEEAKGIVSRKRKTHRTTVERMKAYWHGHIAMALSDDHEYVGKDGATMEDAIKDIEGDGDSVDDLVNYANGEEGADNGVDSEALRKEIGEDIPEGATMEEIITAALNDYDADTIRDMIDKRAEVNE